MTAIIVALSLVGGQVTWALAGTTGGLSGVVADQSGAPVAGATVTVISPSQSASSTTDAAGRFRFLSLAPDTYVVSVAKDGYNPVTVSGQTVFADNSQSVGVTITKSITEIVKVSSRATGSLVKPGTTADVYSVNAQTQSTLAGIGGGFNLNSAYSAIYSQPGVSGIVGNAGQGQIFYIRGASYSQTGYEFDGVPVNRAFDNYNGNSLSNLGQQELQVYTGGSPSSGTSATLGGYVNQVIKTGTYPGFGTFQLGGGTPTFYHKFQVETGGASPNRMFSYYLGFQGYDQGYRVVDNSNGASLLTDGNGPDGFFGSSASTYLFWNTGHFGNGTFNTCPNQDGTLAPPGSAPSGYDDTTPICAAFAVPAAGYLSNTSDREVMANFHFGLPHKNDGGRDDVQLLYNSGSVHSVYNDSINDQGGNALYQRAFNFISPDPYVFACALQSALNGLYTNGHCPSHGSASVWSYQDGYIFAPGTRFGQAANTATVAPYYFPNTPTNRALYSALPVDTRSGTWNDVGIVKLQYQKNLGANAYARLYGYSFYSDWLQNNPNYASLVYGSAGGYAGGEFGAPSSNYELNTHSRGFSLEVADQLNAQNLVRFTANYVTATLNRFNNSTWLANYEGTPATSLADSAGNCYNRNTGALASCFSSSSGGSYVASPTYGGVGPTAGHAETACGYLPAASAACLANASYIVTRPGGVGTTNNVVPKFTYLSLEDEWRPNDRLDLNIGLRAERYEYDLPNSNTPELNFWFNAASHIYCYDPVTLQPILAPVSPVAPPPPGPITTAPGAACPAGPSGQPGLHPDGLSGHQLFTAASPSSLSHTSVSPRLGGTFTINPDTVLRFSAGRYTQPTPAAFEQYLNAYGRSAANTDFSRFFGFGFTNPAHDNPVQTSNNFDFSLEKHLKGTDITLRVSPFYRYTTHQAISVPLGPNFVSAVNLGTQKSQGVEFQIQKGDPSRDGISGAISYTYTSAKIRYENAPNGRNAIDSINDYINAYNKLTQAGGGAACYSTTATDSLGQNAPDPGCAANSIRNPYYAASAQPLLDRTGFYPTYPNSPPSDAYPAYAGESVVTATAPNIFTGFVQWKHARLAIAPNFILQQGGAGGMYGTPLSVIGTDPRTCASNQGTPNNGYPVIAGSGTAGQYSNDYSCAASLGTPNGYLAIPDPYTGKFDSEGAFTQPWQFNLGAQVRYDFSSHITGTLNIANIYNRCFGGSKEPWSSAYAPNKYICGYADNTGAFVGTQPGAGFFFGNSPHSAANGTVGYPKVYDYPYAPFNLNIPVQAYFQLDIKL